MKYILLYTEYAPARRYCTVLQVVHDRAQVMGNWFKRGAYLLVHGDQSRQHSFGTTSRFTGSVPADSP